MFLPTVDLWILVYSICVRLHAATQAFILLALKSHRIFWPAHCYELDMKTLWHDEGSGTNCYTTDSQRKSFQTGSNGIFFLNHHNFIFVAQGEKGFLWVYLNLENWWNRDEFSVLLISMLQRSMYCHWWANEIFHFKSLPGENCRNFLYVAPSNERGKHTVHTTQSITYSAACDHAMPFPQRKDHWIIIFASTECKHVWKIQQYII